MSENDADMIKTDNGSTLANHLRSDPNPIIEADQIKFLFDLRPIQWSLGESNGLRTIGLYIGKGVSAVEVAVAYSTIAPNRNTVLRTWKLRRGNRAAPVLVVVIYPGGVVLCGVPGEEPPVHRDLDIGMAERICREALDQPDRHAALRFLSNVLPSLETTIPGITNEGLLALHELRNGVPKRADWKGAKRKALNSLGKRDYDLLTALGFQIERIDNLTDLLRGGAHRTALAVMLHDGESPETGNDRFNSLSPVSYALKKADDENLLWVLLTQGSRLRLYATSTDVGVGRRGRTETWVECQSSLLADDCLAYLWLIYSADALAPRGSLRQILDASQRFAGNLAEQLRERIYDFVVPQLVRGIVSEQNIAHPSPEDLTRTYEMAITVLFRLLFIAYAEDRDLLPYRTNVAYRRRSLKQKAQELVEQVANSMPISQGNSHWQESVNLWRAVATGNSEWGVPAYDGKLFADQPELSVTGALLADISLPNEIFENVLRHLLVIKTPENMPGPVDFRSLGVREFGTIYEGLLESELALAQTDLSLGSNGAYKPVRGQQPIDVKSGEIYLHNRSGVRKSTGSYYTKPIIVEYLLDNTLEPALDDHFTRLDDKDDIDATETFFDFRVADIAMGSGHFLIGAIDRIEKRMGDYMVRRALPGVQQELAILRSVALMELGEAEKLVILENSQLLRRLIARRCIYGVDLNSLSVQLARLAVWIHTFVPGLPLSFLDHNLVHGNSLVGISTIDEIKKLDESNNTLFGIDAEDLLGKAAEPLHRLANTNDATLVDINLARKASIEARKAISDTEDICNLITARPISNDPAVAAFMFTKKGKLQIGGLDTPAIARSAKKTLTKLQALHFPIAFPEVFLRQRPGFDVILGNPPWQEVTVEEDAFWARNFPGLRGLPQREQEREKTRLREERPDLVSVYESERREMDLIRKTLTGGAYPGMGTGDPDLYKAFCWRFWCLNTAENGRIGVVLPRSALTAKGSAEFRKTIFNNSVSVEIVTLKNKSNWVFEDVTPQYTIGLVCITRGVPVRQSIRLRGPFDSEMAFHEGVEKPAAVFDRDDLLTWNDTASLPVLPDPNSVNVFAQIRKAPRLDLNDSDGGGQWRARPDREMDATLQKGYMIFNPPIGVGVRGPIPNSTPQRKKT